VDGEQIIYKIGFSKARWATGLTSFRREVLEKAFDSGHVARQANKEGVDIPADPANQIVTEKIRVVSIAGLRERFQIKRIDLLQIDTEGFDFEIIKLFNLTDNRPQAIIYENMHLSTLDREACRKHLEHAGYLVRDFAENTLAMNGAEGDFISFFSE